MSAVGAGRTDNPAEKVKVCNTCGDAGFDDCLAFCSHCNEGAEHVYCMVTVFDTLPQDWVCEGCKVKERETSKKRRLVCDGIQPSHAHKKQALSNRLLHSSSLKDSFENGTEHFVTMQADKASSKVSKEPACQVQSMGGTPIKETSLGKADQLPFPSVPTQKLGSNIANERNCVCTVAPDVKKPPHPVIYAKVSSCSETDKAVSTSRCHNDKEKITPKDLSSVSPKNFTEMISTPSNSQSASVVVPVLKEPACLAEPLESVLVKGTSAVAVGMKISGERIGSEEKELNNTALASLSKGKPLAVEAENHNLNETVPFSSSLAKPVASMAERNSVNEEIPKNTDIVIRRSTSYPQHSTINSTFVNSESVKVESSSTTGKVVPVRRTAPIRTISIAERVSADEDLRKQTNNSIENPNPQHAIANSTSLKSDSMKGASSSGTGKVVSACRTAPVPTTPLLERNRVCEEDAPNQTVISLERPLSKLQHALVNSTSMKTESDGLVKRSRLRAATRDFPIITQKIKILGEKGEKIPNAKPKEKLPGKAVALPGVEGLSCPLILGGNVLVKEETATGQEISSSGNKLQAKEEVNILGGSNKSFNVLCEGEKHHQSRGVLLVKGTTMGRETDGSCNNRLNAKEERNAIIGSAEPPSLFFEEEKAQPQNVKQKGGAAGSPSRLISGSAELPSLLFSEEEKTQPQDVMWKGGMPGSPSCLISGSVEPPSLLSDEEKAQPQNVEQKGGAAGSPSCLIKTSGASSGRTAPTHSAPAIEWNVESLVSSPCTMKEPSCDVVPRQEESTRTASGARMDKISSTHSKRVAKRDFPPLKARIEKVQKIVDPSHKETITSKMGTPLEGREQVTGRRSDIDTEKVMRRDFPTIAPKVLPTIAPKVLPGKLKNGSSFTSMGTLTGVNMPLEDKRLSCPQLPVGGVSAKHTASNGIEIKGDSRRLEVEEEVFESKESVLLPLRSHDTRPEDKECLSNAKQECDATVLLSCVTKELPTNGVSSAVRDEVASVIKTAPTNFESASKRKTTKKDFPSPPPKDGGSSSKRVVTSKREKGPSCLPGQMEGVTIDDTSTSQLEKEEVFGREPLSRRDGLNSSVEGEHADAIGGRSIPRQKGEAIDALAASSRQARSSGYAISTQGIAMRDVSDAHPDKVTFTGKRVPSVEADDDFADKDFSDKVKFSPGRHTSRSPCAFNRSASMMDGGDQLSFFEPTLRDSSRRKKAASIGSIRDRYRNSTYIEREFEDDGFHARHEDADCEPSDQMGLWKSTLVRPRHHSLPGRDVEFRSVKQDHYSRGSRRLAGDSGSFKEAYRCHRCDEVGHSTEFCIAGRQREQRTMFSPNFDDRDLPDSRSDPGHAKRVNTAFQGSDGRKPWTYEPRREERFMNSRPWIESNAVDCIRVCSKRPPKVSEHTRFDDKPHMREEARYERFDKERSYKSHMREEASFERFDKERSYKSHMREEASFERFDEERSYKSHMREEASFERESSRLEITQPLNGMKAELKPLRKESEYTRVHKSQIVRVQTQDSCKAGIAAQGPPEQPPFVVADKVFPVQGNAGSFPAAPAGALRGGCVNRPLPNQARLTPQEQVHKDRIPQTHAASRLHGSSIKNFAQERRAAPDRQVMWTGCFNISSPTSRATCYRGIQARPSSVANSKVFEALLALPSQLELEEIKRGIQTESWPRSFQESPPTSHSIGIYFFAADMESSSKWYKPLLHHLAAHDLALKVKLEFAQLLIFPSQLLPEADQCWDDRYFLWGIFKNNRVVEDSSHLLRQPSDKDPGSELGSPTGNGEVIDMDVDMVGGKDTNAVSRAREDFNPPLPPGFPPPPPYPP